MLPNGRLVIDTFVPWEGLYEHGEANNSTKQIQLHTSEIITLTNETIVNKYEQYMLSKTRYIKSYQNKVIAEVDEQMNVLWYYQFEMALILEKHGFSNIQYVNRFLNDSDHVTFIVST